MGRLPDLDTELYELSDYEKGIRVGREQAIQLIQKEIDKITNPMLLNKGYIDGLKAAISVVGVAND